VFRELRITGHAGAILWGYRTAAVVTGWTLQRGQVKGQRVWTLTATLARTSPFELRQTPLLFSAPREKGFWVWPLLGPPTVEHSKLTVRVGPPEH
jgi:hypothetical protein